MDALLIVLIVALAVGVAVVASGVLVWRRRISRELRERPQQGHGPAVERNGDGGRRAEERSRAPGQRRDRFEVRPLGAQQRDRYLTEWEAIQERFVDEPDSAVSDADRLALRVLRDRGYAIDDLGQPAEDTSADPPQAVQDYRAAAAIAASSARGEAGREELRRAMGLFRSLFAELLRVRASDAARERGEG